MTSVSGFQPWNSLHHLTAFEIETSIYCYFLMALYRMYFKNGCLIQAEELGCEGKVEEAQGIMKLCDQLNEERSQLQNVSSAFFD